MAIDNDNSDYEAKRIEQRRALEKQQAKAQQERDPLRSFEAKLSKESVREEATRDRLSKSQAELKKAVEEKGAVLKKILGDKADESIADLTSKAKQHEQAFLQQKSLKGKVLDEKIENKAEEQDEDDHKTEIHEKQHQETQETEESQPKVLAVIDEDANSDGQSFGGGGGDSDDASGDQAQSDAEIELLAQSLGQGTKSIASAAAGGADFSQSFSQKQSSLLMPEDLDHMVSQVEHHLSLSGDEVFAVQLTHDFFEGLKIETKRTAQGVVLTFICPNILVRTEMQRQKDKILKRLSDKNIQVQEVQLR